MSTPTVRQGLRRLLLDIAHLTPGLLRAAEACGSDGQQLSQPRLESAHLAGHGPHQGDACSASNRFKGARIHPTVCERVSWRHTHTHTHTLTHTYNVEFSEVLAHKQRARHRLPEDTHTHAKFLSPQETLGLHRPGHFQQDKKQILWSVT